MKRLWSPWRSKYIESFNEKKRSRKCIFCGARNNTNDAKRHIVWKGKECYIVMNLFPYNSGHLMVVPYRHRPTFQELSDEECLELMHGLKIAIEILQRVSHPEGFNIGANLGRVSGAGIEGHVHLHVVPRWQGDTNFMPVLADTKLISQDMDETYRKLRDAAKELVRRKQEV